MMIPVDELSLVMSLREGNKNLSCKRIGEIVEIMKRNEQIILFWRFPFVGKQILLLGKDVSHGCQCSLIDIIFDNQSWNIRPSHYIFEYTPNNSSTIFSAMLSSSLIYVKQFAGTYDLFCQRFG